MFCLILLVALIDTLPFSTVVPGGINKDFKLIFDDSVTVTHYIRKQNAVFCYDLHLNKINKDIIDSFTFVAKYTKYRGTKWIEIDTSGSYTIYRFKRKKPSKWFLENNDKYLRANYEVECRSWFRYSKEGKLEEYYLQIGRTAIAKIGGYRYW
jgi:hypothetical protein